MREIKINGKTFNIKFSYRAAKYEKCVERAFALASGITFVRKAADSENPKYSDLLAGSCEQMGMTASLCDTFFYAGLIEDKDNEFRPKTEEEAGELLIDYMEETGKNYADIYDSLIDCMEEDGFFTKAGITKRVESMAQAIQNQTEENPAPEQEKTTTKKTTKRKTSTK